MSCNKTRTTWLICVALTLITLSVYWRIFSCEFVGLDDPAYVFQNPHVQSGLTWDSLRWALTTKHAGNWHPLTWISHMLDCGLYGLDPAGHHATNLLFHIVNSILIFLVLQRMTGAQWRSAFVAALFALHPLHVESVAWVAERKDVLSTFFWALTVWAYVRYIEKPGFARYLPVPLLFALGLMAKPMLVTLPFVLLLLDFWPLSRMRASLKFFSREIRIPEKVEESKYSPAAFGQLVMEKVPLLALSFISSVITLWAQAGSTTPIARLPLAYRTVNAVVSHSRYLIKMACPIRLYVSYPYQYGWSIWYVGTAALLIAWASLVAVRQAGKKGYLFTGWFWFLGTLVPVIGLVQVGLQSMADRYTYIPSIGLFIIIAWGGYDLATHWNLRAGWVCSLAALAIAACIPFTIRQVGYWQNSLALFEHALRLAPNNFVAESNLAVTYAERGQLDIAREHFANAAKIYPNVPEVRINLGQVLIWQGKFDEAILSYKTALRCDPESPRAHYGLGVALAREGKLAEAAEHLNSAVQRTPDEWQSHDELGLVLSKQGKAEEALSHFSEAVRISPVNAVVRLHLAMALDQLGRAKEAVVQYRKALDLDPQMPQALNNLAWILASNPNPEIRNGSEAVRLAEQACQLSGYQRPMLVGTLGAAYAEAGRFDEAVAMAKEAEALALTTGKMELAEKNKKMAELFLSRRPFRELPGMTTTTPEQKNP